MVLSLTEEEEESFGDEKSQSSEKDHVMDQFVVILFNKNRSDDVCKLLKFKQEDG